MKILVLGGSGFIGTNFIKHILKNEDVEVINLDRKLIELPFVKELNRTGRYTGLMGNMGHVGMLCSRVKDADVVVNFGAQTHVDVSIENPLGTVETNVWETMIVLEACKDYGTRLVHISTDEVYGELFEGEADEESPILPNNPYAVTKACIDLMIRAFVRTYKTDMCIVRFCNNFGPFQTIDKLIPKIITNALSGKSIPIYGKGEQIRQWLFVEDSCRAIEKVMEFGTTGEIYNVPCQAELSNIDMCHLILERMDMHPNLIEFVEDRKGHDFRYGIKGDKVYGMGWQPRVNFEQAIDETVKWYEENYQWWTASR